MKLASLFVNKAKQATIAWELASRGVEMVPVQSVDGLLQLLRRCEFQAVLLEDSDTDLIDWLAVLQMRMAGAVPVMVVGGTSGLGMSEALQHGATDYAEYNGSVEGLLARLRARVGTRGAPVRLGMEVGPYSLRQATSVVLRDGVEINLTAREFALAWVLFSNVGRVVSAPSLSARVWGRSSEVCKRTLEQHIYKLRRKLVPDASSSALKIHAVYGIGYRLDLVAQGAGMNSPMEARLDAGERVARGVEWTAPTLRRSPSPALAPVESSFAGEMRMTFGDERDLRLTCPPEVRVSPAGIGSAEAQEAA